MCDDVRMMCDVELDLKLKLGYHHHFEVQFSINRMKCAYDDVISWHMMCDDRDISR